MSRWATFVITLLCDLQPSSELCGRVYHVVSSREALFRDQDELTHLLRELARGEDEKNEEETGDKAP